MMYVYTSSGIITGVVTIHLLDKLFLALHMKGITLDAGEKVDEVAVVTWEWIELVIGLVKDRLLGFSDRFYDRSLARARARDRMRGLGIRLVL